MLLKLRRIRLECGWSLSEAAHEAGIAPQSLARVEKGRELPWPGLRSRLSKLYSVPEHELFSDIDEAQRVLHRIAGRSSQ